MPISSRLRSRPSRMMALTPNLREQPQQHCEAGRQVASSAAGRLCAMDIHGARALLRRRRCRLRLSERLEGQGGRRTWGRPLSLM
mmetsp:Transcript_46256/g.122808  ORF Transcript_46256/g.122808 Transcript_46256/m.122808 type:complete len:85 (-) Transcript_46256:54-308(-)